MAKAKVGGGYGPFIFLLLLFSSCLAQEQHQALLEDDDGGSKISKIGACSKVGMPSPRVLWAQREELLYVRVILPKLKADSVSVRMDDTRLVLEADAVLREGFAVEDDKDGDEQREPAAATATATMGSMTRFCLDLSFFRRVESATFSASDTKRQDIRSEEVLLTLQKKWHWMYWPRLMRDPRDKLKSKVGIDWKRWKAEDDDSDGDDGVGAILPPGTSSSEEEWFDDEIAATKEASFPEEEYDDSRVPLLTSSSLKPFLDEANLTLVHVFERSQTCKSCRQLAKLLAHLAGQINRESGSHRQLAVGRIDGPANFEVMKKLHVTRYPQLKMFLRTGEVYDVDVPSIRSSRQLQYYLIEQMHPAWVDVDADAGSGSGSGSGSISDGEEDALEKALESSERIALLVVKDDDDDTAGGREGGEGEGGIPGLVDTLVSMKQKKQQKKQKKKSPEATFQAVAKKFRAQLVKHTNVVFVQASAAAVQRLLDKERREEERSLMDNNDSSDNGDKSSKSLKRQLVSYLRAEDERDQGGSSGSRALLLHGGLVVLKRGEDPWRYLGSWKVKNVFNWLRRAQFKLVEQITPENFLEFRRRGIPMLYILLAGDDSWQQERILEVVKPIAKEMERKVSFVYTYVNGTEAPDLLGHLRCEFRGTSFAVLEDFQEEYRYCIEASKEKPLSFGRIDKLVKGFIAQDRSVVHNPDKIRSEPVPETNIGPVYDVVSDNLMQTVLNPKKDVVIHFYSPVDEKWDYDQTELVKVAEALEEVESIYVGKIDGFKNEKPREFPDIGYFPCTYIFPMNNKMMPIEFNKTQGFVKPRLLRWITKHSSRPEDLPDDILSLAKEVDEKEGGASGKENGIVEENRAASPDKVEL